MCIVPNVGGISMAKLAVKAPAPAFRHMPEQDGTSVQGTRNNLKLSQIFECACDAAIFIKVPSNLWDETV